MGAKGTAVVNFGGDPGANEVTTTISTPGCLTTSHAEAFVQAESHADNNEDNHLTMGALARCTCKAKAGEIDLTVKIDGGWYATGNFNFRWVWD